MGEHLSQLILYAPLSGKLVPITEVPDAVFAQKLVGDGIAIMPESDLLCAPCDGTVTQIHSSLHAITITSSEGVQILLHVGVDTVQLNGRNFLPEVSTGSLVKTGDALISFDVSYLKAVAPSPLCMMVVVNNDMAVALEAGSGEVLAGKSPVLAVSFESKGPSGVLPAGGEIEESPLICIRNPSGLHARPAAVLADSAKRYHAQIYLLKGGQEANAKSITSLLALDVQIHDNVMVRAAGPDAREAIKKIMPLVQQELGARFASERAEIEGEAVERNHVYTTDVNAKKEAADSYYGLPASPGRAVGTVLCLTREIHEDDEIRPGRNEKARLTAALERAGADLRELARRIETASDATGAAIFTAHLEVLQDPEILAKAQAGIQAGESAAHAWRGAFIPVAENLAKLENSLLANRAVDVRDVGHRVLALLGGEKRRNLTLPENVIIVCDEMTPSEIAEFDRDRISGLCAARGSASSHTFILARSLGIPAIAGIDERALGIAEGTLALIDGDAGVLRIHPGEREITSHKKYQKERERQARREEKEAAAPCGTTDGYRIAVLGNISGLDEAIETVLKGGEGVGLLRSEFLFQHAENAPSEEEQAAAYGTIARALGPERKLVVRTLDIGGDKPLAYLPLPKEQNPFLGVRGIRLNRLDPAFFTVQVRSILQAARLAHLHILLPMVATVDELLEAKAIIRSEEKALDMAGAVSVGIMVEVPSAALLAENLAAEVDFFSIGTNDLAQFTLAVDRGHTRLAHMADALHPAVLRLVAETVKGARKLDKKVCICGNLAADPVAVPVLVGLGVQELSVSPRVIPAVKSIIRKLDRKLCSVLAEDALAMLTADEVRRYVGLFQDEHSEDCAGSREIS